MSSDKHKLKHKEKQQKKAKKRAKAAAVLGERTCPCCKKHCPLVKPKCSKGKAVRAKVLGDADAGKGKGKGKGKDAGAGKR